MLVTLDFETFYGKGYTLSSMTNEAYVRDTRFHTHGVGVKIDDKPAQYFWREEAIAKVMAVIPWDEAFLICHNAHFDGSILAWRYGVIPKMYICTKSMGRAVFPNEIASLASLSRLTKIGEKGTELANFYGRERLTEAEQLVMGSYCKNDVELTYKLFQKMKSSLPLSELKLIDSTIRMFTQPIFDVDTALLKVAHEEEVLRKKELLESIGQDRKIIASNPKFAALLEEHGVVPPKKISPSYVKKCNDAGIEVDPESDETVWTYAFAKSDEEFLGLLEHPDPKVQALVECRLGTKSSIIETRTKRFHDIGTRGRFPVYLNYYGAHTGRRSGGGR